MTRWWGGLGVALALLVGAPLARADVSAQGGSQGSAAQGLKTYTCSTLGGCNGVFPANVAIRGFKLISGAAPSACTLYDAATAPATGSAGVLDELSESSANETNLHIWNAPITLTTGLSIAVTGAGSACIVYY